MEKHRPTTKRSFDRATLIWIIGGLMALGVVAFGVPWSEIGFWRAEFGEEIRENRAAIVELAMGQSRIEAILEERLPWSECIGPGNSPFRRIA